MEASNAIKLFTTKSGVDLAALPVLLSAWALLNNYKTLKAGDVILQSNGDNAVGKAVTQLAKLKGLTVTNVAEKDLATYKSTAEATLALCNSSVAAKTLQRALGAHGVMVAYSDVVEPIAAVSSVDVPVSAAIFKDVRIAGFHLHTFLQEQPALAKKGLEEVSALLEAGKVSIAAKAFKLEDFAGAIKEGAAGSLAVLSP